MSCASPKSSKGATESLLPNNSCQELLADQGMNVMFWMFEGVSETLGIKHIKTSVYHPQTDRLVEWFHGTLKQMFKKNVVESPQKWDWMLPPLLFAMREDPQALTGFSPFKLLYGQQPQEVLDLIKKGWEEQQSKDKNLI